eukprot:4832346-Prymnesium_polylepis.1
MYDFTVIVTKSRTPPSCDARRRVVAARGRVLGAKVVFSFCNCYSPHRTAGVRRTAGSASVYRVR